MAAFGGRSAKLCAQPLRWHARPLRLCSASYLPPTSSLAPLSLAGWPGQRRCWPLRPATITTDAARTPLATGSASDCKAHAGVSDAAEAVRPVRPHARVFARPPAAQPVFRCSSRPRLRRLLKAMNSRAGMFALVGPLALAPGCPAVLSFPELPRARRQAILRFWALSPIPLVRKVGRRASPPWRAWRRRERLPPVCQWVQQATADSLVARLVQTDACIARLSLRAGPRSSTACCWQAWSCRAGRRQGALTAFVMRKCGGSVAPSLAGCRCAGMLRAPGGARVQLERQGFTLHQLVRMSQTARAGRAHWRQGFKGIKSLVLSTLFNCLDLHGANPLWPALGYPGAPQASARSGARARRQGPSAGMPAVRRAVHFAPTRAAFAARSSSFMAAPSAQA